MIASETPSRPSRLQVSVLERVEFTVISKVFRAHIISRHIEMTLMPVDVLSGTFRLSIKRHKSYVQSGFNRIDARVLDVILP
jgi:hypothetical protein